MQKDVCPFCKQRPCVCYQGTEPAPTITAEALQKKQSEGDMLVINVLTKEQYANCHISGSISMPIGQFKDGAQHLDPTQPVVLYCSTYLCTVSSLAAKILVDMGFVSVHIYKGGIQEWYQKGLPTKGPCTFT